MFIIFENGKEHETLSVDPYTVFPEHYAARFRPLESDDSADTVEPCNRHYTYEDLGETVRRTLVITPLSAEENRFKRNQFLESSDWTQAADATITNKAAWAEWRQQLRDLPDHANWPDLKMADWPIAPGV